MGRQETGPKSPEKEQNEMEAGKLSDVQLKVMVIKMLKELRTTKA